MARQQINVGIVPGDKRGDNLRVGGIKINENFTELYDSLQSSLFSPVIAGKHIITYQESILLTEKYEFIPAPGVGKVIDLVSLIARITPSSQNSPLDIYSYQTLNVTTDGDTETQDWGYFPSLFLMSINKVIQRMTPVFSTQLFENTPVYACLSGKQEPKSGSSQIELYFLYRIIDLAGIIVPGGSNPLFQVVQSFTNQTEIVIEHNLQKYPTVVVVDTTGRELISEITHETPDIMVIRINPSSSGKIIYS